jgi:hypothetical protein
MKLSLGQQTTSLFLFVVFKYPKQYNMTETLHPFKS